MRIVCASAAQAKEASGRTADAMAGMAAWRLGSCFVLIDSRAPSSRQAKSQQIEKTDFFNS
jgi:hypothetical protein